MYVERSSSMDGYTLYLSIMPRRLFPSAQFKKKAVSKNKHQLHNKRLSAQR